MDDMPHGGVAGSDAVEAWRLPPPKRLVNVVFNGRIAQRWAYVIPPSRT